MTALIYEIVWIRPLSMVFGTTVYAVSTIIASFIFGLAIGSWIAGKYSDRINNPLKFFAFIQIGIGFYGILLLPIFASLPPLYLEIYKATLPNQSFFFFTQTLLSFSIITIPAILMGTTLPLMMKAYSKKFTGIGYDVGKLDASNSIGAVFGTLAAGFALIPLLGIQASVIIAAVINIGMGISVISYKKYLKYRYIAAVGVVSIALFFFFPSFEIEPLTYPFYQRLNAFPEITLMTYHNVLERQQVLAYHESQYGTVTVTELEGTKTLKINGKNQCGYGDHEYSDSKNLALFPLFFYESNYDEKPKTSLNIGLGCGTTSYLLGETTETTTVEIDPAVIDVTAKFSNYDINHNLVIDDGRNWLFRTDKKFDIITSQPFELYENHGSLFTKEFFEIQKNHLTENGIVSQWIPMYSMTMDDFYIFYNTFHSVFENVYIYENNVHSFDSLVMIGSEKPLEPFFNENFVASYNDIIPKKTELNTDDKNILEINTSLNLYTSNRELVDERLFFEEAIKPNSEFLK